MNPLDAHDIVTTLGTIGVLTALFVETGLLVGLFLPGDSLLFVAGLAASGTAREIFGDQLSYTQLMIWAPIFCDCWFSVRTLAWSEVWTAIF